ncbi:MAG TPA: choice-of-anchor P family protein [Nitrospiraceae bacterium]|nr:choice-of-anchor P family protein [Nitrospiraceae bacterium]
MRYTISHRMSVVTVAAVLAGLVGWLSAAEAQTVTGQASAVQATVLGATTMLSDTGTLGGSRDAREASQIAGSIPSLLTGEVLSAATIGYPDEVDSEASLGNLNLTVAGYGISADLVMARALSVVGSAGTGLTNIAGLTIGGVPMFPTGAPNQTLSFGVLSIVLNEQIPSAGGMTVNALHIKTLDGLTDVVIGSAKAGITPF